VHICYEFINGRRRATPTRGVDANGLGMWGHDVGHITERVWDGRKKLFFNIRYKYRQFLDNVKKYPASSSSKRNKTNLLQHNSLRQSLNFDKINTRPNSKFWRPSEGAKRLNVVMYIKPCDWYLSFFVFSIDHQRCVLPMWIYGKESSQTYFLITDANSRAWILYLWLVVSRVYNKKTWHKHE